MHAYVLVNTISMRAYVLAYQSSLQIRHRFLDGHALNVLLRSDVARRTRPLLITKNNDSCGTSRAPSVETRAEETYFTKDNWSEH